MKAPDRKSDIGESLWEESREFMPRGRRSGFHARRSLDRERPAGDNFAQPDLAAWQGRPPTRAAADVPRNLADQINGLRRYARALLGNSSEVEDLVQECLTRALERVRRWSQIRDVRAYLFSILHNVHVDRVICEKRASFAIPLDDATPKIAIQPPQLGQLEIRDLAWALGKLPEEQRQVVLLVGVEGMTYREVAALLCIPVGTVMSRLSRGREALRRLMAGSTSRLAGS